MAYIDFRQDPSYPSLARNVTGLGTKHEIVIGWLERRSRPKFHNDGHPTDGERHEYNAMSTVGDNKKSASVELAEECRHMAQYFREAAKHLSRPEDKDAMLGVARVSTEQAEEVERRPKMEPHS